MRVNNPTHYIVYWLFIDWLYIDFILVVYSLYIDCILVGYWLIVYWLFIDCILVVYWLYIGCSWCNKSMLISAVHKHVRKKWLIYLASNEFKATKNTNLIFLTEKTKHWTPNTLHKGEKHQNKIREFCNWNWSSRQTKMKIKKLCTWRRKKNRAIHVPYWQITGFSCSNIRWEHCSVAHLQNLSLFKYTQFCLIITRSSGSPSAQLVYSTLPPANKSRITFSLKDNQHTINQHKLWLDLQN